MTRKLCYSLSKGKKKVRGRETLVSERRKVMADTIAQDEIIQMLKKGPVGFRQVNLRVRRKPTLRRNLLQLLDQGLIEYSTDGKLALVKTTP